MTTWRRFRALSASDRVLIIEAVSLLLLIRLGLSTFSFFLVRKTLRVIPRSAQAVSAESMRRVAWAVTAASSHVPVRTTCLIHALAGEAMFTRRGWPCDLRFGVQPSLTASSVLAAHSWIEYEGSVVLGAVDDLGAYRVLTRAARGE
jgi:hypothetical protein